jgi:hypothetical protein
MKVCTVFEYVDSIIASADFCMRFWVVHLTIFFFKVKIFPLLGDLPQKYIPYIRIELKYA